MGKLRYRLRCAIRHFSDKALVDDLSVPMRLLGAVLATIPSLRIRARFGLSDALATSGTGGVRCLEVGSGQGQTLFLLKQIGWQAVGLDIDKAAAAAAQCTSGCEVEVATIMSASFPAASFQLVYMSHVLEHLPDLEPSLRRCLDWLSPGGRLVLEYPNPECLTAAVYGVHSCVWDPPRHLVLPSRESMIGMLKRLGYSRIKASTTARRAVVYRVVARQYERGCSGIGFADNPPTIGDRLFGIWESMLVAFGRNVGEEIIVVANKD